MSNQTNSRQALAAIMGTVQTTAHTVTSTFDAANKSIGMLNTMVSNAANRQNIRSSLDNAIFKATLHQEKAQELTESRLKVKEFLSKSQDHHDMYQAAYQELGAVLVPASP